MSVTSLPTFIDALVLALQGRLGLADVRIYGCPVAPEDLGAEGIEFASEVQVEDEQAAIGSDDLDETYIVTGSVFVAAPYPPAATQVAGINAAAKAARDRCVTIVGEVADELASDITVSNTVDQARIASQTYRQGMAPEGQMGRSCWCEFTIEVSNILSP